MTTTQPQWCIRYAPNLTAIVTPQGEIQLSLHGVYAGLKPINVDLNEWKAIAENIVRSVNAYGAMKDALNLAKVMLDGMMDHLNDGLAEREILEGARTEIKAALLLAKEAP